MTLYALPLLDENGATVLVPAQLGTLGYPHAVFLDELGAPIEIPNVPPEAPPVGKFPMLDELGAQILVPWVPIDAAGEGPVLLLTGYVGRRVSDRWRMVQLGDHSRIEFDLFDDAGPLDLTGAALLEVVCRRADRSTLTRTATAETPPGGTVPNRVVAQLTTGDVQSFGDWLMQAHVILAGGRELRSEVRRVPVLANV